MAPGYLLDLMDFLNADTLLIGVQIMLLGIVGVVGVIYMHLFFKKQQFIYTASIQNNLEAFISRIILEESTDDLEMPHKFQRILKNKKARQFAIEELISCKKNFSGSVAENIVGLYKQLGLDKDSFKKLRNTRKWHIKARGIQELYLMDQKEALNTIYKNTNSSSEFVRMEAQTGVIHLTGFEGLRFLDMITYPLTEWQQLKLLEQLRQAKKPEILAEKIPDWLQSKNTTVVIFSLKLADEYQQFSVYGDVIHCLTHASEAVRSQAIKTVVRLADEMTPVILAGYYAKEGFKNKVVILEALRTIATEQQLPFLVRQLESPDNMIKLKAAIALAACSEGGIDLIRQKATTEPEPYQRIYLHVKNVTIK